MQLKSLRGEKLQGHLALLVANVSWGLMAPFLKDLLNEGVITPMALSGYRIIGGALLFWLVSVFVPGSGKAEKVERRDILPLIMASLLVIGLNQVLIILGMSYASPVDAAVVCSLTPIFTLVFGALLMGLRFIWLKAVGVAVGLGGALMFVFAGEADSSINVSNPLLGNTLCLLAQVCGALYLVCFGKLISKYSILTLMKWMFLISAIGILPLTIGDMLSVEWAKLSLSGYFDFAFILLFGTCLAYMLIPVAQRRVDPTVIAMYNYLQPIVAVVFSVLAGLAVLTGMNMLATLLVFAGVWLVNREK
ncbi:MAG: DMT family transporter [bacterium]|nr:DMT family transporter [bacterium]